MVPMWRGVKVEWRMTSLSKSGASLPIFSITRQPISALISPWFASLASTGNHSENGDRLLAVGCQVRIVHGRELHGDGRVGGHDPAPAVLPLLLQFLGRAENADGRLHPGIIEHVVRRNEGRHAVEGEVHLQIAAAMIDAREALADLGRQRA